MEELRRTVARVGPSASTVLITGETGTGKERVARALHLASARKGRFVAVNCAAIPTALLESELFGYEKGAFSGAAARHAGRIELAHGGTLLLDEVGDMPLELQAKLLRVIETREVERLGGSSPVLVDVRILASTHRDLGAALAEGRFREDLYYRLNVFPIEVPPLRARPDDIVPLAQAFAAELVGPLVPLTVTAEGERALGAYSWPGNVRELRNFVERQSLLRPDPRAFVIDAAAPLGQGPRTQAPANALPALGELSLRQLLEGHERRPARGRARAVRGKHRLSRAAAEARPREPAPAPAGARPWGAGDEALRGSGAAHCAGAVWHEHSTVRVRSSATAERRARVTSEDDASSSLESVTQAVNLDRLATVTTRSWIVTRKVSASSGRSRPDKRTATRSSETGPARIDLETPIDEQPVPFGTRRQLGLAGGSCRPSARRDRGGDARPRLPHGDAPSCRAGAGAASPRRAAHVARPTRRPGRPYAAPGTRPRARPPGRSRTRPAARGTARARSPIASDRPASRSCLDSAPVRRAGRRATARTGRPCPPGPGATPPRAGSAAAAACSSASARSEAGCRSGA